MMKKYAWSFDEERYFDDDSGTVEEALAAARECDSACEDVFVGEIAPYVPHICGERVIDGLQEDSFNECGDVSEQWMIRIKPEEEKDLSEMLTSAFTEWAKKYGHMPNFYAVDNVQHYRMPTGEEVR